MTYSLSIGIIHKGVALLDELLGVLLDLFKVIRGVNDLVEFDLNHAQVLLDTLLEEFLILSAICRCTDHRKDVHPPSMGWCRQTAR